VGNLLLLPWNDSGNLVQITTGPFAKLANQNQVDAYISAIGGVVRYIAGAYFDASRVVPTASETRPASISVYVCITY
jgi:hypothetical protein